MLTAVFGRRDRNSPLEAGVHVNRALAVTALGTALLVRSVPADAQERRACAAAYEQAQRLRVEAHLLDARDALIRCSQPTCPAAAQVDCTRWLGEVEESIPTLAVVVRDQHGQDVDAEASIDARPIALDGHAIPVDPGAHVLRVVRTGGASREQRVTAVQGRKNQVVEVIFETPATPSTIPPPVRPEPRTVSAPAPAESARAEIVSNDRPVPALTYVLGGVAVAAGTSFAIFGIMANGRERELRSTCQPVCDPSDVSDVRTMQLVADISLGAAVAAAGGALWTFLARPSRARGAALTIRPFLGGASVVVGAPF
jgi:hypothetical protein